MSSPTTPQADTDLPPAHEPHFKDKLVGIPADVINEADSEASEVGPINQGSSVYELEEDGMVHVPLNEEKFEYLTCHLDNDEDKAKLKAWMTTKPRDVEFKSPKYYDWIAPVYGLLPDQMAKGRWLKELVNKHAHWIGLRDGGSYFKALDYAAGTGLLSHALAPYATKILAIDDAQGMVDVYNQTTETMKAIHPKLDMRAIRGDLSDPYDPYLVESSPSNFTHQDYEDFDLIAMCLAVDFFVEAEWQGDQLVTSLVQFVRRLKQGGTILVIDIEKTFDAVGLDTLVDGRKTTGNSSEDVAWALDVLGMEDIEYCRERFKHVAYGSAARDEEYFILKAKKGERFLRQEQDKLQMSADWNSQSQM